MIVFRRVIVMGLLFRIMGVFVAMFIVPDWMSVGWLLLIRGGLVAVVGPRTILTVGCRSLMLSRVEHSWRWTCCLYILTPPCGSLRRGGLVMIGMGGWGDEVLSLLLLLWVGLLRPCLRRYRVLLIWQG